MIDGQIYSVGLVACCVCVPKGSTKEQIEEFVNTTCPSGISSDWEIAEENFASGEKNPTGCNENPEREHYLLFC